MGAVKMAVLTMLCVFLSAGLIERAAALSQLVQGSYLAIGQDLEAGDYRLVMQTDCNLVLYKNSLSQALWASNTAGLGDGDCFFEMQGDGNAVVFFRRVRGGGRGKPYTLWQSHTCCRNDGDHVVVLQEDGNLVIYNSGGTAIWASGTNGR